MYINFVVGNKFENVLTLVLINYYIFSLLLNICSPCQENAGNSFNLSSDQGVRGLRREGNDRHGQIRMRRNGRVLMRTTTPYLLHQLSNVYKINAKRALSLHY